jgi:hypothetical protein
MDPIAFDTLTRAIARTGTRRRLVALLAALPLGGLLTDLAQDDVAAERPIDRIQQRTPQRNRKQRNNTKNTKNNNNNNNGGGGLGGTQDACGGCPRGQVCCVNAGRGVCCPAAKCCGDPGSEICGCPQGQDCCAGACCPTGQCCGFVACCNPQSQSCDQDRCIDNA